MLLNCEEISSVWRRKVFQIVTHVPNSWLRETLIKEKYKEISVQMWWAETTVMINKAEKKTLFSRLLLLLFIVTQCISDGLIVVCLTLN